MKYKFNRFILCTILSCSFIFNCPLNDIYAVGKGDLTATGDSEEGSIDAEDNSETVDLYNITSDSDTTTVSGHSNGNTSGKVNNTYTTAAKNAYNAKNNMMKKFSSIYDNIDRTSTVNRTSQYPALTQLGLAAINKSTLEDLVSYYDTLTDNLGKSLYNENNDYSTDIYNKSGSSGEVDMVEMSEPKENLTDEQIEEIFDLIAENEGLDTDGTSSASAGTINLQLLQSKDPTILNLFGISDLANILNIYPTTATNILRTDLITGGLYDSDTYTGRYGNLDDYLSYYILNDYDSNLISNAMDDYMTVVSIDDYYITNINYEYAESTTYNQYKFELYDLDTEEMLMSYETNSNHIKFSGVEAGTYLVKSYKAKTDAKSIRVYYSKADYLVDAGTNTILYSKIETAGTTDGISCLNYVEIMNDSEDSWEYLDEDDVTLNSLGEVESNTGTERVK